MSLPVASSSSRWREWLSALLPPLLLLLLVCLVWHGFVRAFQLPRILLPGPLDVLQATRTSFDKLTLAASRTALAAVSGFLLSVVSGTLIAFVFSQSKIIRTSCYPYAIFLQTVPIVAIAPLIIAWSGYGFRSIVLVSFIISLFPIITSATAGMLSADPDLLDLFRLHRASRLQTWLRLRLPASVPYILTGARASSGLAVVGAIVGEFFAGYGSQVFGIGYLIQSTQGRSRTEELFAVIGASTLLGIGIFGAVNLLSATILRRWYDR